MVSKLNPAQRSVTVEWYERGETKGKEVELDMLLALNPELIQNKQSYVAPPPTVPAPNNLQRVSIEGSKGSVFMCFRIRCVLLCNPDNDTSWKSVSVGQNNVQAINEISTVEAFFFGSLRRGGRVFCYVRWWAHWMAGLFTSLPWGSSEFVNFSPLLSLNNVLQFSTHSRNEIIAQAVKKFRCWAGFEDLCARETLLLSVQFIGEKKVIFMFSIFVNFCNDDRKAKKVEAQWQFC